MARSEQFTVKWTTTAHRDFQAIIEYIAEDSLGAAWAVLNKVEKMTATLATMPRRGRVVPELAAVNVREYREIICSPWRIIYRVTERTVSVLAVLDGRRNLEDLLLQRLLRR